MSKKVRKIKNKLTVRTEESIALPQQESGLSQGKKVALVAIVTAFITTFMGSALNLSIPDIEKEFQAGAAEVNWIITIYMLTCAALAVPFGKIADRMERKTILRLGILIFTLASSAAVLSQSMGALLFFRLLQGIGASMIFSTNIAILAEAFSAEERGRILGYVTGANYMGLSAGPVLGGLLNHQFGWRSVFAATAFVSALAFILAVRKLPKKQKEDGFVSPSPLDIKGSFLYVLSLTLMMYGLSCMTKPIEGLSLIFVSGILWTCFFHVEKRAEEPVLDTRLFRRNAVYLCSNLAAFLNYGANFVISYLLSIYLQMVMDYSSQQAGFLLIVSPAVQALLSPWMGKLSDKYSPHILSAIGMAFCAGALFFYGFILQSGTLWLLILALCVTGIGFAMFSSPNTNAVMAAVKKENYGVASSILSTVRSLGHTFSMTAVTIAVSLFMGEQSLMEASPALLIFIMKILFFLFGGVCIVGIFVALKRKM